MDDIFAKKAWCTPVSTRSSTGLSTTRIEESSSMETDSGCVHDGKLLHEPFFHSLWIYFILTLLFFFLIEPSTSKGKATATSLLAKRIHQKDEHERTRNKRHKERMEMDNKLLDLLNKLVEK